MAKEGPGLNGEEITYNVVYGPSSVFISVTTEILPFQANVKANPSSECLESLWQCKYRGFPVDVVRLSSWLRTQIELNDFNRHSRWSSSWTSKLAGKSATLNIFAFTLKYS